MTLLSAFADKNPNLYVRNATCLINLANDYGISLKTKEPDYCPALSVFDC